MKMQIRINKFELLLKYAEIEYEMQKIYNFQK